jgi:DNA-binding CsgD family transcriptional regulator
VTADLLRLGRRRDGAVEAESPAAGGHTLCGAELVEVSERFYYRIFLCALTFVAIATIATIAFLPLRASATVGAPPATAVVAGAIVLCLTLAAIWRARQLYLALRRWPQLELVPVGIAGVLMSLVSPMRNELWWSACAMLVVIATLVPLKRALLYSVGVLTANLAAHLLAGDLHSTAAVTIVGLWIGLPFWTALAAVIPERMAAHILCLNATRGSARPRAVRVNVWTKQDRPVADRPPTAAPDDANQSDAPSFVDQEVAASGGTKDPQRRLTARQLQVVALLADGHRYRSIAACLSISSDQAHRHARNAIERLGVQTTSELVALAVREGIVPATDRTRPLPDPSSA